MDNIQLNEATSSGQIVATKEFNGAQHELVIAEFVDPSGDPVEVSAANPLPVSASIDTTGLATSAKQDTGNTSLASIDSKLTNPLPISGTVTTGGLTDTQLRATPVPVSATDLDIRDLAFATDKVDASGTVLGAGNNNIGDVDIASGTITAVTSITNNVNTVEVVGATIFNGKTTVSTAGTRVTLAASQAVKSVTIKALSTNTRLIYVGNSTVASTNGFQLSAGDSISIDVANLNTINIDSDVNGEGVSYIAVGT